MPEQNSTEGRNTPRTAAKTVKIRSHQGGEFDCYLAEPKTDIAVPAVVLASAVHGVDADIRALADEFAANGFIAAAPDLFWRSLPGPLSHDDGRAQQRSQPRLERIKAGESDLSDTLMHLRTLTHFNGRAAAMGLCYGGPYAIIGPKRLGYAAGISCHGTQMLDYIRELDDLQQPICIMWGDRDSRAPAAVLNAYRGIASHMPNLDLQIFPGVQHGYMLRGAGAAFDQKTRDFSLARVNAILDGLRDGRVSPAMRQAS